MTFKLGDNALTKRSYDDNGFLIIQDNPIAKAGVFDYLGGEVNLQDDLKNSIVKVCRPFSDLEKNKDLFKGKPIKFNHIWVGKNENSNVAEGAIYGDVRADEPYLKADIIIYDSNLIQKIESGEVVELSPAYEANIIKENGTYKGEAYVYRQELKSVNHLAVVECGRSGSDLKIQDSNLQGAKKMSKKVTLKDALSDLLKRFKDNDELVKTKQDDTVLQDSEIVEKIIELAKKDDFENENDKVSAILELIKGIKTDDNNNDELETQDNEAETETQDNDELVEISNENDEPKISVNELVEVIEKITDSKLKKFKDSLAKETKGINDTYAEVSRVLGTNFDYAGKNEADIYKFGFEAITKTKLNDGLDSKTAFRMVANQNAKKTHSKVSDSKTNTKLDELIAKHK